MKNVFILGSTFFVILFFTACAPELAMPIQPDIATSEVDTIIMFDAFTYEESTKIVVPNDEVLPGATYEMDTIITFDADTYEETMEIVKTRVISLPQQKEVLLEKDDFPSSNGVTYRVDTIITFNPDTYEETIQIVRTKIEGKSKKN